MACIDGNIHKIFLSGGTGFFGKSILSMLKRGFLTDCSFVILSRDPELFLHHHPEFANLTNLCFIQGDVRNFTFPAEEFDAVIHAATPAKEMPPGQVENIILDGTRRMLEFSAQCQAKRFLFVSSGAVYGPQPPDMERIPESFPCSPVTEYGIAKRNAEQMCLESGIPTVIARCFAFTGPYLNRNIHFAIGNFIRDCLAGTDLQINGDGTPYRSYLYADDLVEWLFALLARGRIGQSYNVGSDHAVSILELAETVRRVLRVKNQIHLKKKPDPLTKPQRYIPDISRIQKELGVSVKFSLENAILRSTIEKFNQRCCK